MDTQFKLLSVNVYDNKNRYVDENLTYIPENIKIIVKKFLDKDIQNLIKIGKFNMDDSDSYSYGGAGCGDNLRTSYVNSNNCKFALTYYYDTSILDVTIGFNENFNNEAAFIDIVDNMKSIQTLWENVLKQTAIYEVQCITRRRHLYDQLCDAFPMDEDDT